MVWSVDVTLFLTADDDIESAVAKAHQIADSIELQSGVSIELGELYEKVED